MKQARQFRITNPFNLHCLLARIVDILMIPLVLSAIIHWNGLKWLDEYTWWLFIFTFIFQAIKLEDLSPSTEVAICLAWFIGLLSLRMIDCLSPLISAELEIYFWIWIVTTLILMQLGHIVCAKLFRIWQNKHQSAQSHIAIVGTSETAQYLHKIILKNEIEGNFVGFFAETPAQNMPYLSGSLQDLVEKASAGDISDVYITLSLDSNVEIKKLIDQLANSTATVYYVPDLSAFDLLRPNLYCIAGLPIISLYDSPFSSLAPQFLKRVFDLVAGSMILVLISILLVVIGLAIKLNSPGAILFKQRRYGLNGKEVIVWKFRSMTVCEDGENINQATKNDPRVTKLGSFLRRTSLDELPQFINVLQGQMSIVGPRPHAVAHNELYRVQIKDYMLRHKVKPGITGLAQISGYRGETATLDKMEGRVRYDLLYIQNWSLWLDVKILLRTVYKGFISAGAY